MICIHKKIRETINIWWNPGSFIFLYLRRMESPIPLADILKLLKFLLCLRT